MAEHIGAVGKLEHHVDVLLDQKYREGGLAHHAPEQLEETVDDDRGQTEAHFVDHQELGSSHEGSGQREHLLLASRQQAGPAVQQPREYRKPAEDGIEVMAVLVHRQSQVLAGRQREEKGSVLGHVCQSKFGYRVGGSPSILLPAK